MTKKKPPIESRINVSEGSDFKERKATKRVRMSGTSDKREIRRALNDELEAKKLRQELNSFDVAYY